MSEKYFLGGQECLKSQTQYNSMVGSYAGLNISSRIINEIDQEITQISKLEPDNKLCGEDLIIHLILSDKLTVNDVRNFSVKLNKGEYYWLEPIERSEKN